MVIGKNRAEAIVQAVLQPDACAQEEISKKRGIEQADLARKRRVAIFMLIGSAIGVGIAYSLGQGLSEGVVWGGIGGSIVGRAVTLRAA